MKLFLVVLPAIILRLTFVSMNIEASNYNWQQDNYLDYAKGIISAADTRLFPTYPLVIRALYNLTNLDPLLIGIILNLVFTAGAIYLFYKITKNLKLSFLFSLFPPVWIYQGAKVSTEPMVVFLLLLSFYLLISNRSFLAGLVCGLSVTVRLISLCFGAAVLVNKFSGKYLLGLILGSSLLLIFNYFQFGLENLFIQFISYPKIAGVGGFSPFGFLTIISDIFRTIDWKQYKILLSGLFYIILSVISLMRLYLARKNSSQYSIAFYWLLFSLLFIFSLSPIPLLEEYARFLVPVVPAIILAIGLESKNRVKKDPVTNLLATDPPPKSPDGTDMHGRNYSKLDNIKQNIYADNILKKLPIKNGRLLDVGCGVGFLVSAANKMGFKAQGIDVYPQAAKYAKKLNVKVHNSSLEKFTTKEKFDVIVLNHVLEHISNISIFLKHIRRLLKFRGYILISSPNYHSLLRVIFGDRWYGFRPEMHVWQFTPNSLASYLESNGFEILRIFSSSLDYAQKNKFKKFIFECLTKTAEKLNIGDQLVILCRN